MKCIICKKEKENFTKEHIVPEGLGGSLTINRVCKECNDYLGYTVDSPLVNDWLIEIKKFEHKIKGKRKKVKDPLGTGTLANDPERNVIFNTDKNGNPLPIRVSPKIEIIGGNINFSFDKHVATENAIQMINKRLVREGFSPLKEKEIEEIKSKLEKDTIDGRTEILVRKEIDQYAPYRCFVKIAYELGFYLFGDDYLDDAIGEKLRQFLWDCNPIEKAIDKYQIEGDIQLIDHESKIEKEKFKTFNENTDNHLIAVFKNKHVIGVYIRIFCTYEGIIFMSRNPNQYEDFENYGKLIFMDAKNSINKIWDVSEDYLLFIMEKFPQEK